LFSVAQVSNPTPLVEALYINSPMLAAAAVAEAPIPSLQLQETATGMALSQLDLGDELSAVPIVSLLRKVSPRIERDLCDALALRLEKGDNVSEIVGRILAAAGTSEATRVLSKYPSAWKSCLDKATFLSSNFETLLTLWIKTPSSSHWKEAADLQVSHQGVEISPSFPASNSRIRRSIKSRGEGGRNRGVLRRAADDAGSPPAAAPPSTG
jgi:hypothetical protein